MRFFKHNAIFIFHPATLKIMKHLIFLGIAVFFSVALDAQTISTVAGNDTGAYAGDGGPAIHAEIQGPYGVALDAAGNIYIADQYNDRVRKVTASTGKISTIAGNGLSGSSGNGGPATAASLDGPVGIAVDAAGNVYVSEIVSSCVRKINTAGIISAYAGSPYNIGYAGDGAAATLSTAKLNTPIGLALDAAGTLYIADNGNNVVRTVSASGTLNTIAGNGLGGFSGDGAAATDAELNQPVDVACDAAGNIYIADYSNNRIRKVVTGTGKIYTVAGSGASGFGGDGYQATLAGLSRPTGITVSPQGVLFITDSNMVKNVYPTGIIYRLAGTGYAGYSGDGSLARYATFSDPYGGALDAAGNYFVADYANNVIRKIGVFHNHLPSFAGGATQSFSVCKNSTADSVKPILDIVDLDSFQVMNWFVAANAVHGTVGGTATAPSTGTTVVPAGPGITYTPMVGYMGTDTFKIGITDGIDFDTMTVYVTVQTAYTAATLSGPDTLCQTDTMHLSPSVGGGSWGTSNATIATVSASGKITGIGPGTDSILYTLSNSCGSAIAYKPIHVRSHDSCALYASRLAEAPATAISIYPNPNDGRFFVSYSGVAGTAAQVVVTAVTGAKVGTFPVEAGKETPVMFQDRPAGIYFIDVVDASGKIFTGRIVITK